MNDNVDIMYVMRSLYTRNALKRYIVIKQNYCKAMSLYSIPILSEMSIKLVDVYTRRIL